MSGGARDESPYHLGEQAVQTKVGVRERSELVGRKVIRDFMPDQHRELFERLPLLFVGSLDARGFPWASVLWGAPGFVRSPDPRTLVVRATPAAGDPLEQGLGVERPLGLLGIQLATRRRNRMNGRVTSVAAGEFTVRVDQSFGNCPQYIQAREPELVSPRDPSPCELAEAWLSERARALIAESDTCFIASASSASPSRDPREGVDVSHRGGRRGFVRVTESASAHVLTMPDFAGNNAFNTLGNLLAYPRAALLFVDFAGGDLLLVSGEASIIFDGPEVERFLGAQRMVSLRVAESRLLRGALPMRWSPEEPAPQLKRTGSW